MDVHGAGMDCCRCAARVDSAQHPAGFTVDNGHLSSDTAANVQRAVGVRIGGDEPSVLSAPDLAFLRQSGENLESAECVHLGIGEWEFHCSTEQLRAQDVRISGICHRRLDGFVEYRRRMVNEVGVEWIVAGDQHDE